MSRSFWKNREGVELLRQVESIALACDYDMARMSFRLNEQRRDLAPEVTRQAAEVIYLRHQAKHFGAWASKAFFTTSSLEQTTEPTIASHHATRYSRCSVVLEICTGAGCDAAAIAKKVKRVVTIESDPLLSELAELNFEAQGLSNIEVQNGDAQSIISSIDLLQFDGLFADPSRRLSDGRRTYNPEEYNPPLSWIMALPVKGVCGIKISPGVNFEKLLDGWSREFIGFRNECREQVLWRGTSVRDGSVVLVDKSVSWEPPDDSGIGPPLQDVLPGQYLIEPHGALIRSGKLHLFFMEHGMALLDEKIAYGVAIQPPAKSPFYDSFAVKEVMPYDFNRLRARIKDLEWNSRTEIKKRGVDQDPDELRKKLKFLKPAESDKYGVILLARIGDSHKAILGERVT